MDAADRNPKARPVAVSGILLAVAVVLMYLNSVIPVASISILILISFFTGIVLSESNSAWALLFFAAVSLLSLLLPVNKLAFFAFYTFFGYYGIVKYHIEKINSNLIGYLLKAILVSAALLLNYFFAYQFLPEVFQGGFPLYLLMAVALVFLFIYDYVYTMAMIYYDNRLKKASGR